MRWIVDPGHAWLKVNREDAQKLAPGMEVTPYSYMDGRYFYLEEDVDAAEFLRRTGLSVTHEEEGDVRYLPRVPRGLVL